MSAPFGGLVGLGTGAVHNGKRGITGNGFSAQAPVTAGKFR